MNLSQKRERGRENKHPVVVTHLGGVCALCDITQGHRLSWLLVFLHTHSLIFWDVCGALGQARNEWLENTVFCRIFRFVLHFQTLASIHLTLQCS